MASHVSELADTNLGAVVTALLHDIYPELREGPATVSISSSVNVSCLTLRVDA